MLALVQKTVSLNNHSLFEMSKIASPSLPARQGGEGHGSMPALLGGMA